MEEDDPGMFAEALLALLDDQPRREWMGRIGLQRSIQLVGLDRSRKALLEGYARLERRPAQFPSAQTEFHESVQPATNSELKTHESSTRRA